VRPRKALPCARARLSRAPAQGSPVRPRMALPCARARLSRAPAQGSPVRPRMALPCARAWLATPRRPAAERQRETRRWRGDVAAPAHIARRQDPGRNPEDNERTKRCLWSGTRSLARRGRSAATTGDSAAPDATGASRAAPPRVRPSVRSGAHAPLGDAAGLPGGTESRRRNATARARPRRPRLRRAVAAEARPEFPANLLLRTYGFVGSRTADRASVPIGVRRSQPWNRRSRAATPSARRHRRNPGAGRAAQPRPGSESPRNAITAWMSSQVLRFSWGLRRRYAGW